MNNKKYFSNFLGKEGQRGGVKTKGRDSSQLQFR